MKFDWGEWDMWGYVTPVDPATQKRDDAKTAALFALLENWFLALEDGSVLFRYPDPAYTAPEGWPEVTETLVNELILELDKELNQDADGYQGQKVGATARTDMYRLAYPQRLALVQAIQTLLHGLDTTPLDDLD